MEEVGQSTDIVFLKKIFESVNVDLERDTLLMVITQSNEFSWNSITKKAEFEHLVFFGSNPKKIGLQFEFSWYQIFDVQEQQFLFAEPLHLIATDRSRKGALWNALKKMFLKK